MITQDIDYDTIQHAKSIRKPCYENCYNWVPTCVNGEQCREKDLFEVGTLKIESKRS